MILYALHDDLLLIVQFVYIFMIRISGAGNWWGAQRAVAWTGAVSEVKVSCRGRRAAAQGGGRGAAIY